MAWYRQFAGNFVLALLLTAAPTTHADAIVDWNIIAGDAVTAVNMGTPPANRVLAIAHTAAAAAIAAAPADADSAFVDTAIAAAFRRSLVQLVPTRAAAVEDAFRLHVAQPDATAIALGERAANDELARHAGDDIALLDDFRPAAAAGEYVPTTTPAFPNWARRTPWHLRSADALRPPPPPALTSDTWARDYEEIRALGARDSRTRSAEQTAIGRFWEATLPPIYHGVARAIARQPGRTVAQNARMFARVTQAMDDTLIAVFDAKYHYRLWRPVTAIRNGDRDGNDATQRDATWAPLIETPMHPEYPCAHCAVAAAVATVLKAEIGADSDVVLATNSSFARGAERRWPDLDAFVREVSEARIVSGVHYRFSTAAGRAIGEAVGKAVLAADPPRGEGKR